MIKSKNDYLNSSIAGIDKLYPAVLVSSNNMLIDINPVQWFGRDLDSKEDEPWTIEFPSDGEIIAVPPQDSAHSGNAIGVKIVADKALPAGWSNANYADAFCCQWPDGTGGWAHITELKPVDNAAERSKALKKLTNNFNIAGSFQDKHDALAQAISELGDDVLAEQLVDHATKILKEST